MKTIFEQMNGHSLEEQVYRFRQWMKEDRYGLWHMTPEVTAQYRAWMKEVGSDKFYAERDRQEQLELEAANAEYNATKDEMHGPYCGGRQW